MEKAQTLEYLEHPIIRPRSVEFRLYQKQIADVASDANTIVILPTALGKTIISILVAANVLYSYRDAKVLVMAPTRPLVMQHRESFTRLLRIGAKDVHILTGTTPPAQRETRWREARLFFSTPQVVDNDLKSGRLSLEGFGLLVFDECHRAVKRYAYVDIAESYISQASYPLILGMTASPGSEIDRVMEVCDNLYIERVEYRTEGDPDVKPYIQSIDMEWRPVDLPQIYRAARSQIRHMLDRRLRWLNRMGFIGERPEYIYRRRLIELGYELRYFLDEAIEEERGRIFSAIMAQSLALTLYHMLELLETQGFHTLKAFMEKLENERREKRTYAIVAGDPLFQGLKDLVERNPVEHPKVDLLREIVAEQVSGDPSSRMLVFTQYRDTASHLVEKLSGVQGVRADRFVGQASKPSDMGLTQEEQAERIRMLRDGTLNVLVATSIAEEGLDIPAVDHVVFYEPIPSEIRYIQRRGRTGRRTAGRVSILAAKETMDMAFLNASRRRAEKMKVLVRTANSRLQKIVRKRPKPLLNPMSVEELGSPADEIIVFWPEEEVLDLEQLAPAEPDKTVEKTAENLYLILLERGLHGASLDDLALDMEPKGVDRSTLKRALEKLTDEGVIVESGLRMYVSRSAMKDSSGIHVIRVDRVHRGFAAVTVDDMWEALLEPEDYTGPRSLIKKGSSFRASAELYGARGTLHIWVKDVIEKMND